MRMIAHTTRNVRAPAVLLAALLLSAGCATTSSTQPRSVTVPTSAPAASLGSRAAAMALEQLGVPYRYGGSSPRGFDCSGLVHYAYRRVGRAVPRTTGELWARAAPIDMRKVAPGDLLFFRFDGKMSHVGLYVGNGRFVHAPSSGRVVTVESLESGIYADALVRSGRIY